MGHLGMTYEVFQAENISGIVTQDNQTLQVFYFSFALTIIGVGFIKRHISTIVRKLYQENDPKRGSGFTIFYASINFGARIALLICAYLGEAYG